MKRWREELSPSFRTLCSLLTLWFVIAKLLYTRIAIYTYINYYYVHREENGGFCYPCYCFRFFYLSETPPSTSLVSKYRSNSIYYPF